MSLQRIGPFEVIDPRFIACIPETPDLTRLWSDGEWVEGPAWLDDEQLFIWSDIPNNRMMCWSGSTSQARTFRAPSNGANGNTVDRQGRLVTCEQYSRRITRTDRDGRIHVLVDRFKGARFNAPNDVVVKSDGSIWFSDPDYGASPDYQGVRELAGCHVYRHDPGTAETHQVTSDFVMPNGLAFSPDETVLYIIDTGSTHLKGGPNHIRRFRVDGSGVLRGGEVIIRNAAGALDGLRVDCAGRLWCSAEDGVHCYSDNAELLGKIILPQRAGNLCFGDTDRQTLFICASQSVYRCRVAARGC